MKQAHYLHHMYGKQNIKKWNYICRWQNAYQTNTKTSSVNERLV